jgi:hypothetical protein
MLERKESKVRYADEHHAPSGKRRSQSITFEVVL